jgi:hypothetical protein
MSNDKVLTYENSTVRIRYIGPGDFLSIVDKLDDNVVVLSHDDLRLLQEALDAVNEERGSDE